VSRVRLFHDSQRLLFVKLGKHGKSKDLGVGKALSVGLLLAIRFPDDLEARKAMDLRGGHILGLSLLWYGASFLADGVESHGPLLAEAEHHFLLELVMSYK
jgi:hypothetical protein